MFSLSEGGRTRGSGVKYFTLSQISSQFIDLVEQYGFYIIITTQ